MDENGTLQIFSPQFLQAKPKKTASSAKKRTKTNTKHNETPLQDVNNLVPSAISSPFKPDTYNRPKYRRSIIPRSRPFQAAVSQQDQQVPVLEPQPSYSYPTELAATSSLDELRKLHEHQQHESMVMAAMPAAQPPATPTFRKKIKTSQYRKVGLNRENRLLKVLIPSDDDKQRLMRERHDWLLTDVTQMKKELLDCHLIKHGTNAKDETIRTMYMAMKEVGVIKNSNISTQWHNYLSTDSVETASTHHSTIAPVKKKQTDYVMKVNISSL